MFSIRIIVFDHHYLSPRLFDSTFSFPHFWTIRMVCLFSQTSLAQININFYSGSIYVITCFSIWSPEHMLNTANCFVAYFTFPWKEKWKLFQNWRHKTKHKKFSLLDNHPQYLIILENNSQQFIHSFDDEFSKIARNLLDNLCTY